MPDNYKSLPFILGLSLLFFVPVGIGGFVYSSLRDDVEEQKTTSPENSFEGLPREQNIKAAPIPSPENSGSGGTNSDSEGIPIGKYSNPPTRIESFGEDAALRNRPLDDSRSIVDRNRLIQQNTDKLVPDYSEPSASNGFKRNEDNSLIEPLEDDFLEVPETEDDAPLSPVAEPLFGQ